MDELISEIKHLIVETLNLEDVDPNLLDENEALFGDGLGLDSIDALELIVMMEKNYGIELKDASVAKQVFGSVKIMADYISKNRTK